MNSRTYSLLIKIGFYFVIKITDPVDDYYPTVLSKTPLKYYKSMKIFDDMRNTVESILLAGQCDAVVAPTSALAFHREARFTQPGLVGELIRLN